MRPMPKYFFGFEIVGLLSGWASISTMKMEIPFWSSLYAPKATISPSLVFAAYFSKSRSLMHNQPADFFPTSLFSRPSERAGATSEGNRVGSLLGVPGGVFAQGCAVSPPSLFGMVDLISDMPAIRSSFQDVAIFSDSLYYSNRPTLTTPIFRRNYYKITLLTGSGLVTMPLFTNSIKLALADFGS